MKDWYVYICRKKELLYTGITTNIVHRMGPHKAVLLYKERYPTKEAAAKREKQIKGWNRARKLALIEGKSRS
jgi:predicted GIY-YIG superfamily endonuclease